MPKLRNYLRFVRSQNGFAMLPVMSAMLIMMAVTFAALASGDGDVQASSYDLDRKAAYAAAEAGVNEYLFHLSADNAYYAKCTTVTAPAKVNQVWNGTGADPRQWRTIPGSTSQYTIELLPANGYASCDRTYPDPSMIDTSSRTLRIRVTGKAGRAQRSITGAFRRRGFLDYIYLTDYETTDPVWYVLDTSGDPTSPDLTTWASDNCVTYWRDGRGTKAYSGQRQNGSGSWSTFNDDCGEIQFASADHIDGPFHTNDSVMTCAGATFGRNAQDRVELSAPATTDFGAPGLGWRPCPNGGGAPNAVGTWTPNSPIVTMPPSNTKLKTQALSNYRFTGQTAIQLSGNTLKVTNAGVNGGAQTTLPWPSNGIIYVLNGACGIGYNAEKPYNDPVGCADVSLSGDYTNDLTIASEKDIIVTGDVRRTADALLGLIANNFVRVYHPVTYNSDGSCNQNNNSPTNITIDAAILTLQHSFTVDHYYCGNPLGTLTVNGAISQRFRGPVGTGSGGSISHGYIKNYQYDDRFAFRTPPSFMDPVQSAWRLLRQTEQIPATKGP